MFPQNQSLEEKLQSSFSSLLTTASQHATPPTLPYLYLIIHTNNSADSYRKTDVCGDSASLRSWIAPNCSSINSSCVVGFIAWKSRQARRRLNRWTGFGWSNLELFPFGGQAYNLWIKFLVRQILRRCVCNSSLSEQFLLNHL